MKAKNFEELQKKQDELRNERNKLTDEYRIKNNELQQQIDAIDLKKYCADDFLNKYVVFHSDSTDVYMYIKSIDRLFRGPRYNGYGYIIGSSKKVISIYNELSETVSYENLYKTLVISKAEYYKVLNDTVSILSNLS